jgi:hypothetical protein
MSAPPLLMRLKIHNEQRDVDIWLPLFLGWIILLAVGIAILPVAIFLFIVLWPAGWGKFILLAPVNLYRVLRDMGNLQIEVKKKTESLLIYFK